MRNAAVCIVLFALAGCVAEDDGASQVASESGAIEMVPVLTDGSFYMPPVQTVREAFADRVDHGGMIPNNCKAFQTIIRAGSTLGTFRAFGVCVRPYERIVFQVEGDIGGVLATTAAGGGASDLAALNQILSYEAARNSNEPDFSIGGGGLFPKGGPPQPGGTDPRVVVAAARQLQNAYDLANQAILAGTSVGGTTGAGH